MDKPIQVFFSYAHKDTDLMDQVRLQLKVLELEGRIVKWYDRMIEPGSEWNPEIESRLMSADIVLLLVSPDFINSSYCYDIEVKLALKRHESGAARVIPIILRPCLWTEAPFAKLQALPRDGKAITTWKNTDEACYDVALGVLQVVNDLEPEAD